MEQVVNNICLDNHEKPCCGWGSCKVGSQKYMFSHPQQGLSWKGEHMDEEANNICSYSHDQACHGMGGMWSRKPIIFV